MTDEMKMKARWGNHSQQTLEITRILRGHGFHLKDIAAVTGVSKSAISYNLRKHRDSLNILDALQDAEMAVHKKHNPTDNDRIRALLEKCFIAGKANYGHGFRIDDDTRQWGTEEDSWLEMGLEEVLDAVLYLAAHILRLKDAESDEDAESDD